MLYTDVYLFLSSANIIKIYNYVRCSVRVERRKETWKKAFNSEKILKAIRLKKSIFRIVNKFYDLIQG